MKTYQSTHPWITFSLDLGRAPAKLWILLGEARSKCDHLVSIPLKPKVSNRLHQIYLAKGVQATTAIEGNTLTEEQVIQHLKGELRLPPSKEYLAREVDNIIKACNTITEEILGSAIENVGVVSESELCRYNREVLEGLDNEDHVVPGHVRESLEVTVGPYRGAPAADCRYLLQRLCGWLNEWDIGVGDDLGVVPVIIKAVLAHLYLAWIHPFADGNGRTARLLEFKILVAGGVPTVAAHLLSNHYNQTRSRYVRELSRASRTSDGVISFLLYAVQGFVDQLVEQIRFILAQQHMIAWKDLVHETFGASRSTTKKRQRDLALAIARNGEPVPYDRVTSLTTDLALAYGKRTRATLQRDLKMLRVLGLIVLEKEGYRAKFESMFAFLPRRREEYLNRYLMGLDSLERP
ncbi:MAG: Fic family protein [Acidobacteria bacterium]|nr:Fic family protein [Acidobacteriota bacterium]